jgi:acylphosphatase
MAERLGIHLTGRVQGVGFRWYARERADELGLVGWVRNLPDGSVRLVVEGPREDLQRFLAWCREGPPVARVHDVATSWSDATGEFSGFRISG